MNELTTSILFFALYFGLGVLSIITFKFLYVLITPFDEWVLIKEQNNSAAAISLGGAFIGFSIAISGAASNSVSIIDFATWVGIAFVAQILGYLVIRFIFMPKISQRIKNDEISAGIILAATSISFGLLNAACMSY